MLDLSSKDFVSMFLKTIKTLSTESQWKSSSGNVKCFEVRKLTTEVKTTFCHRFLYSAIKFNIHLVAQRWLKMGIICLVISVILALIVALFYYNGLNKGFVLKLR